MLHAIMLHRGDFRESLLSGNALAQSGGRRPRMSRRAHPGYERMRRVGAGLKPAPTCGWDTNRSTASISIRLVVADVTSAARKLTFGRVAERVTDRQTEQHAFDAVERHGAERKRRAECGECAGRKAEPALCDHKR